MNGRNWVVLVRRVLLFAADLLKKELDRLDKEG
jgi:hypothetical protein